MSNENKTLDQWEEKLEDILKDLISWQNSKNLNSCKPCGQFFECVLKKKYVIAVYESMNKGSSGGFEF